MDAFVTADGTPLARQRWPVPPGLVVRGTVLLVHGLGEHAGRYAHVAAALNAAGWSVEAYDQRGHGRSGGARGAIPSADTLLRDLALVLDAVRADGTRRLVLLGHSMGGLIAARFVAEGVAPTPAAWARPVDALVLSSPALDAGLNAVQKLMLAAGSLAPDRAVNNGLKPEWISRDAAVVRAYVADPLVHDRVTPRLVRFIVDGGEYARAAAPRWAVPTLLLWAGADRCVAPAGSAAFAAAAPQSVLTARCFDGLFHEIFNEPEREQVMAELLRFLDALPESPP